MWYMKHGTKFIFLYVNMQLFQHYLLKDCPFLTELSFVPVLRIVYLFYLFNLYVCFNTSTTLS